MTVREFLKGTMRLIGVIATGETPSNEELQDGLTSLNSMIAGWSTENLLIHLKSREEFSLVSGTQSYTLGPSGTFNTTRPAFYDDCKIENQSSTPTVESPLRLINVDEWSELQAKDQTADIPNRLYVERGASLDTLYFYPKPSATNKFVLYSSKPFTAFATLDTAVTLPPGYERALRYNHALELAPEYGKTPSPEVVAFAMESKENIKRQNIKPAYLSVDAALLVYKRPFNIYNGE